MSARADHVVTARHNYTSPYLVAFTWQDRRPLVDMILREEGLSTSTFHVAAHPIYDQSDGPPTHWLTVGHHNGFGAALYFDDPHFPHHADKPVPTDHYDWAWITRNPHPLPDPPQIQYDLSRPTVFPPRSVLPPDLLRTLILEWADTGQRPTTVPWQPVNLLSWDLTDTGDPTPPRRRNHRHTTKPAPPP